VLGVFVGEPIAPVVSMLRAVAAQGRLFFLLATFSCSLAITMVSARAEFVPTAGDYAFAQRRLCYVLVGDIAQDGYWISWIENAVANWNKVKGQTGWQFRKCEPNQKADIRITFGVSEDPTDSAATGFQTDSTCRIAIVQKVSGKTIDGKTVSGGVEEKGWRLEDQKGETTIDPIKVVMHELTHCMRLSHRPAWSKGDFEYPFPPGNHTGRTPTADDLTQLHNAAWSGKPAPNITYPLPPCFPNQAARDGEKAKIEKLIDQEKQKLQAAEKELTTPSDTRTTAQVSALYAQAKQAVSNIEMLQDLLDNLPGVCPPPATITPPTAPGTVAPTHSSRMKPQAPVPSQNTEEVAVGPHAGVGIASKSTVCPDVTVTGVTSLGTPDTKNSAGTGCGSTGFGASIYVGYDWSLGLRWLAGIEADVGYATNNKTIGVPGVSSAPGDTLNMREDWDESLRVRLGYAVASRTLIYATAGLAWQDLQATVTCSSQTPFPCGRFGAVAPMSATNAGVRAGWTLGGGIEYALVSRWKLRGEYRYSDYGSYNATYGNPANLAVFADVHLRDNIALLGLTYAFGETPAVAATSSPPSAEPILSK